MRCQHMFDTVGRMGTYSRTRKVNLPGGSPCGKASRLQRAVSHLRDSNQSDILSLSLPSNGHRSRARFS